MDSNQYTTFSSVNDPKTGVRINQMLPLCFFRKTYACTHCTPDSNSGSCKGISWTAWPFAKCQYFFFCLLALSLNV